MTGASQPLGIAPKTADDWRLHGLRLEAAHDLAGALDAFQRALELDPTSLETVRCLAAVAFRRNLWDLSEKFYAHLITHGEQSTDIVCAYAATLREQGRYDEAISLLKDLIGQRSEDSSLWEGLGTVVAATGDRVTALTFFEEALRLAPGNLHAIFNRGCARMDTGDLRGGLRDMAYCAAGFKDPENRANAELTAAHAALALGDLAAGWRWYDGRHMRNTPREVHYDLKLPRRKLSEPITKKRIFISAEQGLGDEVLFGSLLPELAAEVAHLGIGVEPRLVPLFQRSFPKATVVAHHTEQRDGVRHRSFPDLNRRDFDTWALMGDFLAERRGQISDFPTRPSFLTPDPARVAFWRDYFAALNDRPKIGILWKSLKLGGLRAQLYSPFTQWQEILAQTNVQFVNLQYGDTTAEMAEAKLMGFNIITPEGIDLKDDLDDLAALTSALYLILGPSNATSNIAAACGVPVWMLTTALAWPRLGQGYYPWYPSVRLFSTPIANWQPALDAMHQALKERYHAA